MLPNMDQVSAAVTTLVVAGLTWTASKGWVPGDLVTVLGAAVAGVIIHFLQNTQKAVVTAAAKTVTISAVEQAKAGIEIPVTPNG